MPFVLVPLLFESSSSFSVCFKCPLHLSSQAVRDSKLFPVPSHPPYVNRSHLPDLELKKYLGKWALHRPTRFGSRQASLIWFKTTSGFWINFRWNSRIPSSSVSCCCCWRSYSANTSVSRSVKWKLDIGHNILLVNIEYLGLSVLRTRMRLDTEDTDGSSVPGIQKSF